MAAVAARIPADVKQRVTEDEKGKGKVCRTQSERARDPLKICHRVPLYDNLNVRPATTHPGVKHRRQCSHQSAEIRIRSTSLS